ncbi:uracil-DNA glycosylase family protein [Microbulbifer guangxiensis]|uniref:uracil-DNA glycosylase family protein n=1 Tax=Microbulbifer guangxiensis TaxID=2904249 RepID=UPI001F318813|nr:uracil-DNA glycosylase family protein [Microbulbifer guangxiensis]
MHERHRAEYLEALGVPSYVPRYVLPLAPAPRQAQLPAAPAEPASNPLPRSADQILDTVAREVPAAQPPATAAQAPQMARELESLVAETRPPAAAPAAAPVPASAETRVEPFVLSCWWLGDELLAVDSREPGAALPVEALFNNMARALRWHDLPRDQDRLRWPLAENRFAAAASASDARDTCSIWLEAASARRPVKTIWLMGQQAQEFCAPVPLEGQVTDWNGIRLLSMPSLSELLQAPERKREVWQLLQSVYPEQTRAR